MDLQATKEPAGAQRTMEIEIFAPTSTYPIIYNTGARIGNILKAMTIKCRRSFGSRVLNNGFSSAV